MDHRDPRAWDDLPPWARRAAIMHGGLGPWAISGAIAGRDAAARLRARHPDASIVAEHSVDPDRQRTPYTCVMDGLRAGAELGESEVRFVHSPGLERGDPAPSHGEKPTTIFFVAFDAQKRPLEALRYTPTPELLSVLHEGSMDGLAADARRLIPQAPEKLFTIESVSVEQWR